MSATTLDTAPALRAAILGNSSITSLLAVWQSAPAVFTRVPVPDDATFPCIVIPPPASISDVDFLTTHLPVLRRDLMVYGLQAEQFRVVDEIAYLLRQFFHRQPRVIDMTPAYWVVDMVANGPIGAPAEDDRLVGRAVLLRIRLRDLAT